MSGEGLRYQFGVYMRPNGKLVLVAPPEEDNKWAHYALYDGKRKAHPIFRITQEMVLHFNEGYFADREIGKCEYLGEL